MGDVERGVQRRARRTLDAVIVPQDLRPVRQAHRLEWGAAGMRGREGEVPARVPILRQHDMGERRGEAVDERHDLIAARNGKRTAGHEIILHVDNEQHIARADVDWAGRHRGSPQ